MRAWPGHPSALGLRNTSLPPPCLQALLLVFAELLCHRPPVTNMAFSAHTNLLHSLCCGLIRPCNRPDSCCKCTDHKQDQASQNSCRRLDGQAMIHYENAFNHSFACQAATYVFCVSTAAAWQTMHSLLCCTVNAVESNRVSNVQASVSIKTWP